MCMKLRPSWTNFLSLLKCRFTKLRREEKACVSHVASYPLSSLAIYNNAHRVLVRFSAWKDIRKKQRSRSGLLHLLPLGTLIIQKLIKYRSRLLSITCFGAVVESFRELTDVIRTITGSFRSLTDRILSLRDHSSGEAWNAIQIIKINRFDRQTVAPIYIAYYSAGVIFIHIHIAKKVRYEVRFPFTRFNSLFRPLSTYDTVSR